MYITCISLFSSQFSNALHFNNISNSAAYKEYRVTNLVFRIIDIYSSFITKALTFLHILKVYKIENSHGKNPDVIKHLHKILDVLVIQSIISD